MSRVLVTGGVGRVGSAVVRRLLADPAYEVRVADRKGAPQWMREACEIRAGDLRDVEVATAAIAGCACVIHLASPGRSSQEGDYSLIAQSAALDSALLRAAIDHRVERLVFVSCASAIEQADEIASDDPGRSIPLRPQSASGFAKLVGERLCRAAQAEHGLPITICRPATPAPAHDGDMAAEIVAEITAEIAEHVAAEIVAAISGPAQ